jgi:zinc protease
MKEMTDTHSRNYPSSHTVHRQELANGITVLVYERFASQSVFIDGAIRAGSVVEDRETAGLANYTAISLMRGTEKRTFDQIYEVLESIGADMGFSSGHHVTGFSAHGLVEDVDLLLDLLADSLRQPTFPADHLERVRGQLLTALQIRANDTQQMASLAFYELLYPGHPYGRSQIGYVESIDQVSRAQIVDFHRQYFGPQNMLVTIVGAIKAEDAVAKVEAVLGDWTNPQQKAVTAVPSMSRPQTRLRTHVSMPDKHQSDIRLGLPGPLRSAPDYLDASLMNTILGVFGMMGRIGKRVREEQGLAYYAYSQLQGGLGPTPWSVVAGVAPTAVDRAISTICDEITRIQNELVPDEELADSQAYRTGSMPVSLETNSGLANVITDIELYQLGMDYLLQFPDLIRSITAERIQTAAQKYLSSEQIGIAVAGPKIEG